MEAIKPTQTKDEQLLEMAKELPEVPTFYKYRDIAKTMMDHGMFIKSNKGLQWQIDDLALKLEHCKVCNIPMTWANSLYIANGKFGMEIDLMSWIVRTQCPDAQFVFDHGNDKECVIKGRRTILNPNAPWQDFKYTLEMAQANNLIRGSNWLLNQSNMINKNAYANAYRGLCRAELENAYIKEEIGADEDSEPIQKAPKAKKESPPTAPKEIPPALTKKEYVDDVTPEESYDEVEITSTTPLTIDQTVELAKQLIIKKKSTKKAEVIEKKTLAEMNAKDPLQALEKLTNAPAQPPDSPFMEWIKSLDYKNGWYLVYDAEILAQEGTDYKVKRKLKEAYIETVYVRGNNEGRGLWIAGGWMRGHAEQELFNGAVRKVVDI